MEEMIIAAEQCAERAQAQLNYSCAQWSALYLVHTSCGLDPSPFGTRSSSAQQSPRFASHRFTAPALFLDVPADHRAVQHRHTHNWRTCGDGLAIPVVLVLARHLPRRVRPVSAALCVHVWRVRLMASQPRARGGRATHEGARRDTHAEQHDVARAQGAVSGPSIPLSVRPSVRASIFPSLCVHLLPSLCARRVSSFLRFLSTSTSPSTSYGLLCAPFGRR